MTNTGPRRAQGRSARNCVRTDRQIRDVDGHVFFPDDVELVTGGESALAQRLVGYRQVTDAHLLALARRHCARLATLDHMVRTLAGEDADDVVEVPVPPIPGRSASG